MRLTLRTMLAYQDSVLEPADAEVLGREIEESDFASGLAERIRSVAKKLAARCPEGGRQGDGQRCKHRYQVPRQHAAARSRG